MKQSGILMGISLVCLLYIIILTELGKYFVGIRYELYVLYYGLGFIPICIHRLGHSRIWKLWYKQHVIHHHIQMYPSKNFDAPSPYKNTLDWKYNGNVLNFTLPSLLACILISSDYSKFCYLAACVGSMLVREDYIHEHIHLTDSPWKDKAWFKCLKSVHRIHHRGAMDTNYGFVDLFFDYWLGTLELPSTRVAPVGSAVEHGRPSVSQERRFLPRLAPVGGGKRRAV